MLEEPFNVFENPIVLDFVRALRRWHRRINEEDRRKGISDIIDEVLSGSDKGREQFRQFEEKARIYGMMPAEYIDTQGNQ